MKLHDPRAEQPREDPFLGFEAEAPLKLHDPRAEQPREDPFLGFEAEAPLKQLLPLLNDGLHVLAPFLGFEAEAPLKPCHNNEESSRPSLIPRLRSRGPVEARPA